MLPRLYRHLVAIPPYGSEEYETRQRRKKSSTTTTTGGVATTAVGDNLESLERHRQIEKSHNEWQRDVEAPIPPPKEWGEKAREGLEQMTGGTGRDAGGERYEDDD